MGKIVLSSRRTFREIADKVLRLTLVKTSSANTKKNTAWQTARLKSYFGPLFIDEIDEETWAAFVAHEQRRRRLRGLAPRKFFDNRKHMRKILRFAKKKRLIEEVPDLPIPDPPGTVARAPSLREIALLEKHATANMRFQIQLAWRMGLRKNEIFRLRVDQVDTRDWVVRFPASTQLKRKKPGLVPVPKVLRSEFSRRIRRAPCQWLFWNPTVTGPVTTHARPWRRARELSGVRCRFHDLRHACASQIVERGGSVPHGASYMRHSPAVFAGRYVHTDEKALRGIARLMAR